MVPTDRAHARALDASDPLADVRGRFVDGPRDEADLVYLDGNSLGRPPVWRGLDRLRVLLRG